MLTIHFYPESDHPDLVGAAQEYQHVWDAEGSRIILSLETISGLRFVETAINALVFEGISHSYPLCLRASYATDVKIATLSHELCHRLIRGNQSRLGLPPYRPDQQLYNHQLIDLFLFDVWTDLYGEEFARRQVVVESQRQPFYKDAWDWALAFDRAARTAKLRELLTPQ